MALSIGFCPLYQIEYASSRHRVFQFLPFLREAGIQFKVLPAPQRLFRKRIAYVPRLLWMAFRHDVLFVQKRVFPGWVVWLLQFLNARIVFDLDDAVYLEAHVAPKIAALLRITAVVIAGNDFLAGYARQFNDNVVVVPTVVNTDEYQPVPALAKAKDAPLVIGWIGNDPNRGDFQEMKPVLDWLGKQYGNEVVLRVISGRPLAMETAVTQQFVPWQLETALTELQKIDIGIMPLLDNAWTRGKCGFKLIEYMALGLPVVASPVGVNGEIVQHSQNGFLADDPVSWQNYLTLLIEDAELRRQMGLSARQRIEAHYSIQAVLPTLINVLHQAAEGR